MCQVPSWIQTKDAILFLTDKDAKEHKIDRKDATGHSAIRKVWPNCEGEQGEGLGKHTPQVVVDALLSGKMNNILKAGDFVVTDGEWTMPNVTTCGNVYVRENTTLTMPNVTACGYVDVRVNAKLTMPNVTTCGYVDVWDNATITMPNVTTCGYVDVRENATFYAPKLRRK